MEHWYPETHYLVSNLVRKARGSLAVDDGSLEEIGQMLTTQNANGDAKWIQQLQKLPLDLRKAVDTTFAFDFELFGYNPFR